jgi:hypothetical protein
MLSSELLLRKLYSEEAVLFEAEQRFEARRAIGEALRRFRPAVAPPARNHDC